MFILFNSARYRSLPSTVGGASKIKLKKANKKRRVTFRRVIILYLFLKASIDDLTTLVQNSKVVATSTEAIVVLTPSKSLKKGIGGY
jgi:hypothetical protein